jgi:hypothetical protein
MSHEPDVQLEFVETDALLSELFSRFDHAVFCGVKHVTGGHDYILRQGVGHELMCAGMTQYLGQELLKRYDRISEGCDDDDDDESDVVPDDDDEP